ncbi:MAG: glycosyltransferase family 4 protein [Planctomycetales bacterium]|nr:glycosyltransferase family 4 protein [Planctomycetales bacterium]
MIWHVGGEDVHMRLPLLRSLRGLGYRVGAVGSGDGRAFAADDIPYYNYPLNRWISPFADRRSTFQLRRLIESERPDVVHAFDTKPSFLAPAAAAGLAVAVRTITGMGYVFSSQTPLAAALRPVYRQRQRQAGHESAVTIFQNQDDYDYFIRHRIVAEESAALVRSSGVDCAELLSRCPDESGRAALRARLATGNEPVVTMVARMVATKGVRQFLGAARRVRASGIAARFLLAGPLASEGKQAVRREEFEAYGDDVTYLGPCDDVPALLSVSDLFVLPTYYREGVPRVLLEAGAIGLPLITTDMPGCRDVVRHKENGLLVRPRDEASLVTAITQMLSLDESTRRRMGNASRRRVHENFELRQVAAAYAAIYDRSLSLHGVRK